MSLRQAGRSSAELVSLPLYVAWHNSPLRQLSRSVNIGDTIMSREISPKRKYELKKRADDMADTRLRITEAAIELHGSVGPSRTTMSAVAGRAGVERRT